MDQLNYSYTTFLKRIDEISQYIEMTMLQTDVLQSFHGLELTQGQQSIINYYKNLNSLTIQYNAFIISLYGCFENYIDDIIGRYLDILFENTNLYENISDKIKQKYKYKLGNFLSDPQRFVNMNLDATTAIQNYTKFLSSDFTSVNKEFLLHHAGNLRMEQITAIFNDVGIPNFKSLLLSSKELLMYHTNIEGIDIAAYDVKCARKQGDLFIRIDELIEQRNNVSHGWYVGNRISCHDLMTYTIPFLKIISEIILRICLSNSAKVLSPTDYMFGDGKPIAVHKNQILCINSFGNNLADDDYIIYCSKDKREFTCAKIKRIQENCNRVAETGNTPKDIGIELDRKISKNHIVMILVKTTN